MYVTEITVSEPDSTGMYIASLLKLFPLYKSNFINYIFKEKAKVYSVDIRFI